MRHHLLAFLVLLVGCRGKATQCNDFIRQGNEALDTINEVDRRMSDAHDPCTTIPVLAAGDDRCDARERRARFVAFHEAADAIEREMGKVAAVPVKDAELARLGATYVAKQKETAVNVRGVAALFDDKRSRPPTVDELAPLVAREKKLAGEIQAVADDINRTCNAR